MKKLAILLTAAVICTAAMAQERKDLAIGFDFGVNTGATWITNTTMVNDKVTTENTQKSSLDPTVNLGVNLSIFAGRHFAITPQIEYIYVGQSSLNMNTHFAYVGVGFHYYVPIVSERFYYTPGLDLNLGAAIYADRTRTIDPYASFYFAMPVHFGRFEFKPTDHWGIHIDLVDLTLVSTTRANSATVLDVTTTNATTVNTLQFNINYGMSVGVKYYF